MTHTRVALFLTALGCATSCSTRPHPQSATALVDELFADDRYVKHFGMLEDAFDSRCRAILARADENVLALQAYACAADARRRYLALDLLDCMGKLRSVDVSLQVEYYVEFYFRTNRGGGGFSNERERERERIVDGLRDLGQAALGQLRDLKGHARERSVRFIVNSDPEQLAVCIDHLLGLLQPK